MGQSATSPVFPFFSKRRFCTTKAKTAEWPLEKDIVNIYDEVSTDDYYEDHCYSPQDGPDICIARFVFQQPL